MMKNLSPYEAGRLAASQALLMIVLRDRIVVGMATLEIAGQVLLTEPCGRQNQGQPERWTNAVFHGAEPSRECVAHEPLR